MGNADTVRASSSMNRSAAGMSKGSLLDASGRGVGAVGRRQQPSGRRLPPDAAARRSRRCRRLPSAVQERSELPVFEVRGVFEDGDTVVSHFESGCISRPRPVGRSTTTSGTSGRSTAKSACWGCVTFSTPRSISTPGRAEHQVLRTRHGGRPFEVPLPGTRSSGMRQVSQMTSEERQERVGVRDIDRFRKTAGVGLRPPLTGRLSERRPVGGTAHLP